MENNSGKKLIWVVLIIIILAVALAVWLSVRSSGEDVLGTDTGMSELSFREAQNLNRDGVLEIPDQFPGAIVYVSRVELPAGGWVVVKKLGEDGTEGDIIGRSFFDRNMRIGNVDLVEPTEDGASYVAQAYTDDGDAQFNSALDKSVVKRDNTVLEVRFLATRDLPERKD